MDGGRMPELAPVLDDLGADALPASIEITLRAEHTTRRARTAFVSPRSARRRLRDLDHGEEWITRVDTFLSVLAASRCPRHVHRLAALFLVGNTIHLVVYARRDELQIMRLVGASDRTSSRRSCSRAALQGALGGHRRHRAPLGGPPRPPVAAGAGARARARRRGLLFLPASRVARPVSFGGVALGTGASWGAARRFLAGLP